MNPDPDPGAGRRAPVLDLVDRLEASGALGSGGRLPALLRYLVLEELAGRGDRVKAYMVATEVLGRGRDFDPQTDAIVRVEMGRLRRALDLYFATGGRDEAMRIAIARGSMRPRITGSGDGEGQSGAGQSGESRLRSRPRGPIRLAIAIAVFGLSCLGLALVLTGRIGRTGERADHRALVIVLPAERGGEGGDALRAALQTEIATELGRPAWLAASLASRPADALPAGGARVFALRPILLASEDGLAVSVALTREPDKALIWTGRYRVASHPESPVSVARRIATQIAREIAYPTGPLGQAIIAETPSTRANEADPFLCLLHASRYWRDFEPKQFADARACLTRLTARDTSFAEGRAALAFLLIDEARAGIAPERRQELFADAASLVVAAPARDTISLSVQMTLAGCRGDIAGLRTFADRLEAAAPHDADMLADIANELGPVALDWERALAMENKALESNANPPPWYPLASSLKSGVDGDYEQALKRISLVPQRGYGRGLVATLAFAALAGAPKRLEAAQEALRASGRLSFAAATRIVEGSCWHPDVKAALHKGLETARADGAF